MSSFYEKNIKKDTIIKNNCKLYSDKSIQYSINNPNSDFYKKMKNGYIEMAQINLELAAETEFLVDINSYETWLSGE